MALEDVVFGDEVARAGVQRASEEGGEDQVVEGVGGAELDEDGVEEELDEDVDEVDGGEGHGVDEDGADGVEEDLEGAEEGFAEEGVEEYGFKGGGEVGVEAVDAEGFVVCEVVWLLILLACFLMSIFSQYMPVQQSIPSPLFLLSNLIPSPCLPCPPLCRKDTEQKTTHPKARTIRNPNRQIRHNRQRPIHPGRPKRQIMRYLMNSQEQILIRSSAHNIRRSPELPAKEGRVAEQVGA